VVLRFSLRPSILRALLLVATLTAILGAKFVLIDRFGSDLPYWDQWDGEGDAIYRPYLEGTLKVSNSFRPHNEHRIVPTLLLALGLFELNDRQWDGRLQMTVNTFLHGAAALLLVSWAWRWFSLRWVALFAGLVVVFFSTAVSWENTLSGFQSQFYFLLLFSLLHLAATLLTRLNELGRTHGIGRLDLVENRFVGMKSRGMYETPGGTILLAAHRGIESLTLDRGAAHLKDELMPKYAELIYNGFWFAPEREMLQAAIDRSQEFVTGRVRLKLYKGSVAVVGRESPYSLYDQDLVTFEEGAVAYDHRDAAGFIRLNALRLRTLGQRKKKLGL